MRVCSQCSGVIEPQKYHNTKYCQSCADWRKKEADRTLWLKKKREKGRANEPLLRKNKEEIKRLEALHAKEIGLNLDYYQVWKDENPREYKAWIKEKQSDCLCD